MNFDVFLDNISENQCLIIEYLDSQFLSLPEIGRKMRFKIPFYDYKSWVCYLNPVKNNKVELCFIWGKKLSNVQGILEDRNRKQVSGVIIDNINEININSIMEIFSEALVLDEQLIKKV